MQNLLRCVQVLSKCNFFWKTGFSSAREWKKVKMLVASLCPTLCDPIDWSLLGSSLHGILQARILKWLAMSSFRDLTWVSSIAGRFFTVWATRKPQHGYREWQKHGQGCRDKSQNRVKIRLLDFQFISVQHFI